MKNIRLCNLNLPSYNLTKTTLNIIDKCPQQDTGYILN